MDFLHKNASDISIQEIERLYLPYQNEMKSLKGFPVLSTEEFQRQFFSLCDGYQLIEGLSDGEPSALLLYHFSEGEKNVLEIPVFGYYYRDIRDFSRLFDELLREVVQKTTVIYVSGYCCDKKLYRFLTLTQFGVSMEYCVRKLRPIPHHSSRCSIVSLTKTEIEENWPEIWALVSSIINHLKGSPVFYFGDEFTEEAYHEFFLDDSLSLYVAKNENGQFVGLIEANVESEDFILSHVPNRNVGEAIVLEEYRGTGLAEALLATLEKDLSSSGVSYSWVNHGTANPNAMGFWDKYFKPYRYEFERTIEI